MKQPPDRRLDFHTIPGTAKLPWWIFLPGLVLIIAILYWAQAVLIPVALSILLTFLLSPLVDALEHIRLGRVVSVILVVVLAFTVLAGMGWILAYQVTSLADYLPKYRNNITQKVADLRGLGKGGVAEKVQETVEEVKEEINRAEKTATKKDKPRPVVVEAEGSSTFWPIPLATGPMVERIASAGLVIALVIFMLIQREDLRNRLIRLIGHGRMTITTKALEEAGRRISRYMLMQSIINGAYGLIVGSVLFLIGLPYAFLWGFLAAVLRFIPYVGPWMAAIMPGVLSLGVFQGWLWPIAVIGLFLVLELLSNLVMEPLLYGDSAGISQVALLVTVAFWTWLWGPIGLVMATPLTVCLVVLGKYVPQMEFITVLMSDASVLETHVSYYQRLLAMDQDEATEIVDEYLKAHPPERVYDEVLIPGLCLAKSDRRDGKLTEAEEQSIFRATRELVENLQIPKPENSNSSDVSQGSRENGSRAEPKIGIVGCPARDEADELALLMLQQLLASARFEMHVLSAQMLSSEVISRIGDKNPALICVAALPPGGVAQTRYLCKKLRAQFARPKIVVARWAFERHKEDVRDRLLSAGVDQVGTTLLETRDHLIQLSQLTHGEPELDRPLSDNGEKAAT